MGPCLRANWSSPERRKALKAAATSLKVLRAGAAPGDSAALTAKLLARAAPASTTRDDAALAAQLATAAKTLDERAQCVPFGSAATGLGDGRGDVDLCLLLPEPCIFDVNKVAELLKGPPLNAKKATAIATARVPVARATLPGGVRLDVVVNARRELCNTALLKELGARRPQLAPLCRAARAFSRAKKFGGNHRRHLSHYAWTVLCVRVLQLRGELPALPCPALTALAAADTLTWTAALAAANADLDAAGVVKTAEDDGALAGRFVDLLRLVAFARTDIITTRGARARSPPTRRSTATASASRTRSRSRATSAPSSRGGRRRSSGTRASRRTCTSSLLLVTRPTRRGRSGRFRSWLRTGRFVVGVCFAAISAGRLCASCPLWGFGWFEFTKMRFDYY